MAKRGAKPKKTRKPKLPPAVWRCPAHLDGVAADEYTRIVGVLREAGVLDRTTPRLVELYAINYALLRQAYVVIERDGPTVESDRGNVAEHPAIKTLNAATIRIRGLLNDFGLSPASAKLTAPTEKSGDKNPWEGILNVVG